MKKRLGISGLTGLVFLGLTAGTAGAAPSLRFQVNQKGDVILIGNTLAHECGGGTPAPDKGTVGDCGSTGIGDSAPDVFWRADSPNPGDAEASAAVGVAEARSSAMLALPAGAYVNRAFLYWSARKAAAGSDDGATLSREGGFSADVGAIDAVALTVSGNHFYQSVADVTELVQANGAGSYRVSGVDAAPLADVANDTSFAGWWLVVFYQLASEPPRSLALLDGFDLVNNVTTQNTSVSGFLVPGAGKSARLGVIGFEGDNSLSGDQVFFYTGMNPGGALTNALNSGSNFFNSTRSYFDASGSVAGDLPQLKGTAQSMAGVDIDIVDVAAKLMAGDTSVNIRASSSGDQYYLGGLVTSIATSRPDFASSLKTATDLNGGLLLPGDVIEYAINVKNEGNDAAVGTVLTDELPAGVTFVSGSLQITQGVGVGAKTDVPLDDEGEYDLLARKVTVRLGAGANGVTGGKLLVGESVTVVFQVTVDADAVGSIENQATISAGGEAGSATENTPTDGNGSDGGSPPTVVGVDACATDADCPMATPYCDTSGTFNKCVECTTNAHCPGTEPACEPLGGTCVCIPTGLELCDGLDNTCEGQIDEGNPGGGLPCSAGQPGICDAGLTACSNAAINCAPVITPGTTQEVCNNGLDDDCDGETDDADACGDADGDGLPANVEAQLGTDPTDGDSDDDGVPDGEEVSLDADSDGDGLINALDADSDNDGLFDGTELGKGCQGAATDASKGSCVPDGDAGATVTNPIKKDTDNGGVSDGNEDTNLNGVKDAGETDPNDGADDMPAQVPDADKDGLGDALEATLGTDPNDGDSDDDGVSDGLEPNPAADSDGDGQTNAVDMDSDNDGLFDGTEMGLDCSNLDTDLGVGHCLADADGGLTKTSPISADTDRGGVSDGSEDANLNGAIDSGELDPNDDGDDASVVDADKDGLSDGLEATLGTNPNDADSDNDGILDGDEANPSSDPDDDGKSNAADPDSDGDGLLDGTEIGTDCSHPMSDKATCVPDGDGGATTTSPLERDTDGGGTSDGAEDADKDGVVDAGETDPNNAADDVIGACQADSECGGPASGMVCDAATMTCIEGYRCPSGQVCSSESDAIGTCSDGAGGRGGAGGGGGSTDDSDIFAEGGGCKCALEDRSAASGVGGWLLAAAAGLAVCRRRRRAA
jgi:clumping factor A